MSLLKELLETKDLADLAVQAAKYRRTVSHFLKKVEQSTLPQAVVDEIKAEIKDANLDPSSVLSQHDIEELAHISGASVDELMSFIEE